MPSSFFLTTIYLYFYGSENKNEKNKIKKNVLILTWHRKVLKLSYFFLFLDK
jgi:hypothetical protein